MRKIFVLANLHSGKRKSKQVLDQLLSRLDREKLSYAVFFTHPTENQVALHLDSSFTDLIVLGGDGTLNQAVNGLAYAIPMSIIPCGTGNDYAKCFDLGKNRTDQIETALFGTTVPVDVGICNGRKFLNGVGIGFDGQIVADMVQKKTWLTGPAKYYYHVLKILSSYKAKPFSFKTDFEAVEKNLILLCIAKGTTFGGSFVLTPSAKLDDGHLHVCEVGDLAPLKRFLNIGRLQTGSHTKLKEVRIYQTDTLLLKTQPQLFAHIDGEYFGSPPFEFSVIKRGLQIRVMPLR